MTTAQNLGYGLKLRRVAKPRDRAARRRDPGDAQARRLRRAQRDAALRRPAPARGARPRARRQPRAPAARRAAVQPRCAHPRGRAPRDQGAAGEARHHHHPRHPRPRGSDGDGRPHRHPRRRTHRPARHARGGLQPAEFAVRRRRSWAPATCSQLEARPADGGMRIEAGAHNDARAHPRIRPGRPGGRPFPQRGGAAGPGRSGGADRLLLRGRIVQASYPGGFYRYAVAVGQNQFMVDDTRRLAVGENVGHRTAGVFTAHLFEEGQHETQLRITRGCRR